MAKELARTTFYTGKELWEKYPKTAAAIQNAADQIMEICAREPAETAAAAPQLSDPAPEQPGRRIPGWIRSLATAVGGFLG